MGGFSGGTSHLARPPQVLPEPDVRPPIVDAGVWGIRFIADLTQNQPWAAFDPSGDTLYVWENNRGFDLRDYSYPGLVEQSIVVNNTLGPVACDGDGEVYWTNAIVSGSTAATQVVKNPSSPTALFTTSFQSSNPIVTLCWSPFDDLLYLLVSSANVSESGLWSLTKDGSTATLVDNTHTINVSANTPVPTLDGAIWWSNSAAPRVYRYDIGGASTAEVTVTANDVVIPQPDNTVIGYMGIGGTFLGRRIDASMTTSLEPAADVLAFGQRAVAYLPDLSVVTVERRVTGEVWEIGFA